MYTPTVHTHTQTVEHGAGRVGTMYDTDGT